jgi:hypothetical protein
MANNTSDELKAIGCGDNSLSPKPIDPDCADDKDCTDLSHCMSIQRSPRPISGLSINPNSIQLKPLGLDAGGAFCMPANLSSLTEWLQFIEKNIIRPYCDLIAAVNCSILISKTDNGKVTMEAQELRRVLVSCLGLDDDNPHIVYNPVLGVAEAGKIDSVKPDCAAFVEMLKTCPPDAPTGEIPNKLVGYRDNGAGLEVYRYGSYFDKPTRFWAIVRSGYAANNHASVAHDQRLFIADTAYVDHEPGTDGGSYDPAITSYTFGFDGWYRVTFSVMFNFKYSALAGWIIAPMTGIYHQQVSVNPASPPAVEYRLDETTLYFSDSAIAGQDVTLGGSILIKAGVGDIIRPRAWFSNTYIPSGGTNRNVAIHLNKSAETVFSIARESVYDTQITG